MEIGIADKSRAYYAAGSMAAVIALDYYEQGFYDARPCDDSDDLPMSLDKRFERHYGQEFEIQPRWLNRIWGFEFQQDEDWHVNDGRDREHVEMLCKIAIAASEAQRKYVPASNPPRMVPFIPLEESSVPGWKPRQRPSTPLTETAILLWHLGPSLKVQVAWQNLLTVQVEVMFEEPRMWERVEAIAQALLEKRTLTFEQIKEQYWDRATDPMGR